MLGTFSPQAEPYQHVMPEETTPSGIFARGSYSARTKVNHFIYMAEKLGGNKSYRYKNFFLIKFSYISIYLMSLRLFQIQIRFSLLIKVQITNLVYWIFQFVDDDNKCYLEINYTFDIRKNWQWSIELNILLSLYLYRPKLFRLYRPKLFRSSFFVIFIFDFAD